MQSQNRCFYGGSEGLKRINEQQTWKKVVVVTEKDSEYFEQISDIKDYIRGDWEVDD